MAFDDPELGSNTNPTVYIVIVTRNNSRNDLLRVF
jgi:hypothetical protein